MEEKKNTPAESKTTGQPDQNKWNKLILILMIVFMAVTGVLTVMVVKLNSSLNREIAAKTEVINEKEDMIVQLQNIKKRYEELGNEHEGLKETHADKIAEITKLIAELEKANADVSKFRGIVWSKQKQLDEAEKKIKELERINLEITEENMRLQDDLDSTQTLAEDLSDQNLELNEKVATGSQLKAYEIIADAIRIKSSGKEIPTSKANRADKLRFCFLLSENKIAPSGQTNIFIRIADPNNKIYFKNKSDLFEYEDTELVYSLKGSVDYKNQMMDLCYYWDNKDVIVPGLYNIDIFCNDYLIGSSSFQLEK